MLYIYVYNSNALEIFMRNSLYIAARIYKQGAFHFMLILNQFTANLPSSFEELMPTKTSPPFQ